MTKDFNELNNVQQQNAGGQVNNQAVNNGEIVNPQTAVKAVNDIVGEAVGQPTSEEQQREERRRELQLLRVMSSTEVPPEEPALMVDGVGLFALGDIHALKGKQKCGKTTALKVCLAALMQGRQFRVQSGLQQPRVLYLDTEQKRSDVKLIVTDTLHMTGLAADYVDQHLQVYALRRRDFTLLMDYLRLLINDFRPQVVVIDGIVEFVASFNDEAMAKQLIHDLLGLSEEQRQQLQEQRRAEMQQRRQEAAAEKQKERLDYALRCIRDNGGSMSRKQLTEILVKKFEVERTTISRFIATQVNNKVLYESNRVIYASDDMALAF